MNDERAPHWRLQRDLAEGTRPRPLNAALSVGGGHRNRRRACAARRKDEVQNEYDRKIGSSFGFASYRYEDRASVSRSGAADMLFDVLDDDQEAILCQLALETYALEQSYAAGRAALITGTFPLRQAESINESSVRASCLDGAIAEGRMGVVDAVYLGHVERMLSNTQKGDLSARTDTPLTCPHKQDGNTSPPALSGCHSHLARPHSRSSHARRTATVELIRHRWAAKDRATCRASILQRGHSAAMTEQSQRSPPRKPGNCRNSPPITC